MNDLKFIKSAFRQRQVPSGGPQGTKKGKRGYDRKRFKAETRRAGRDA